MNEPLEIPHDAHAVIRDAHGRPRVRVQPIADGHLVGIYLPTGEAAAAVSVSPDRASVVITLIKPDGTPIVALRLCEGAPVLGECQDGHVVSIRPVLVQTPFPEVLHRSRN